MNQNRCRQMRLLGSNIPKKCVCGRGSASDPTGGAHSAPPGSLAEFGWEGGREEMGREGKGQEGRGGGVEGGGKEKTGEGQKGKQWEGRRGDGTGG